MFGLHPYSGGAKRGGGGIVVIGFLQFLRYRRRAPRLNTLFFLTKIEAVNSYRYVLIKPVFLYFCMRGPILLYVPLGTMQRQPLL